MSKLKRKTFISYILLYAVPILLQDVLSSLVNISDTYLLGILNLNSINAGGFANQIFSMFTIIIFGITSGSMIFMGQFWGNRDIGGIHKSMGLALTIATGVSLLFAAASFLFPERLIGVFTAEPEVIELGASYLRIVAVSYVLHAVSQCFSYSLRSIGRTDIPMITIVSSLVLKVLLTALFLLVLKAGIAGAAYATVISRAAELIAQFVIIKVKKLPVLTKLSGYMHYDKKLVKRFIVTVLPVVLNELMWGLGTTLYSAAYKFCGNDSQGAFQIARGIQDLFINVGIAAGSALCIIMTNSLGAGEREESIKNSRRGILLATGISVVMGTLMFLLAPLISRVYPVSGGVQDTAGNLIRIMSIIMIFKTVNYAGIIGVLRSGGDTVFCMIADGAAVWIIGLPFAFTAAAFFKLPIEFVLMFAGLEEVVKTPFILLRVKSNRWARNLVR